VYVFDFGRTTSGWARLNIQGLAGTAIKLPYGEKLTADGQVDTSGCYSRTEPTSKPASRPTRTPCAGATD
jgi:hypothetical protein